MRHELETTNSDNMAHLVPRLQHISDQYNTAIAQWKRGKSIVQALGLVAMLKDMCIEASIDVVLRARY